MIYPSIRIEGAILSPDIIDRLEDLPGQKPADFGLESGGEPELPMFGPPEEGYGTADNPALVQAAGEVTSAVLAGELGPARNATILGAAVALKASGRCLTLAEGVDAATDSLDSGAAREVLERARGLLD